MLGIHVIYTAKPGRREEFLSRLAACGAPAMVRGERGCVQYDYFLSAEHPDQVLLLEKWTSREEQQAHLSQPHMALVRTIKDDCIDDTALETFEL